MRPATRAINSHFNLHREMTSYTGPMGGSPLSIAATAGHGMPFGSMPVSPRSPCLARSISANHFLYDGQYLDSISGLYYLRARWYDPATGQFTSVDALVALTDQPYSYAGNNPINGGDFSGLCASGIGQFYNCNRPYFTQVSTPWDFPGLPSTLWVDNGFMQLVNSLSPTAYNLETELYVLWFNVYQTRYGPATNHGAQPSSSIITWVQSSLMGYAHDFGNNCSFPGRYFLEFACSVVSILGFYANSAGGVTPTAASIFMPRHGHQDASLAYLVVHSDAQLTDLGTAALNLYQDLFPPDASDLASVAVGGVFSVSCSTS